MKKAFTMLELIFVIVIAGILSIAILPSFNRNTLQEAADQLVSHIRYTQHLAMMDDKFIPSPSMSKYTDIIQKNKESEFWYKGRWQIAFFNVSGETPDSSFTAYSIFSDTPSTGTVPGSSATWYDGNPNQSSGYSEVATNPEDNNRYLIGANHSSFTIGNEHITKALNLNKNYGIGLVSFLGGCSSAHRVSFDNLGRPIQGDLKTSIMPYEDGRIVSMQCIITLTQDDQNIKIAIEPETGYTHIL